MGKHISNFLHNVGRFVKACVGLLLVPLVVGLLLGTLHQLQALFVGPKSFADWASAGAVGYVGVHLFLYQPEPLFRMQHVLLSRVSSWLFGGQVSTSEAAKAGGKKGDGKPAAKGKSAGGQGSALLVLSPYLVPLYPMLICAAFWTAKRWVDLWPADAAAAVLVGAAAMFHWVMTAHDLQRNRERFPIDAYLLALAIIGVVSTLAISLCLPMVADVSLPGLLSDALSTAAGIYTAVFRTLFA